MSGARTVSTGKPRPAQRRAWAANRRLRAAGLAALRPGSRACDVFAAVAAESAAGDIPFWEAAGVGHGVGTSEHEAPHLAPFDTTPLAPGMVVALAVYSFGPEGELICDKDVFHITAEGPELLTWYKDYSDLYALFGTSARHG
jgi:Xaa-Pro aminopeptidase